MHSGDDVRSSFPFVSAAVRDLPKRTMSAAAASSSGSAALPRGGSNAEQDALVRDVLEPERTPVQQTQVGEWIDSFRLKLDGPIGAQRLQLRDYLDIVFGRNIGNARRGFLQEYVIQAADKAAMLHPEEFDSRADLLLDGDRQEEYWMMGAGFILATNTFMHQAQSQFSTKKFTEKDHTQLLLLKANMHYIVACVWSDSPECMPSYLAQCVENPLEARRLLHRATVDFYNGLGVYARAAPLIEPTFDYSHHFANIRLFDFAAGNSNSADSSADNSMLEIQLITGKMIFERLGKWYDCAEKLQAKSKRTQDKDASKVYAWHVETENILAIHLMTQAVNQLTNMLWARQRYREVHLGAKSGDPVISNSTKHAGMLSKFKLPDWAALSQLYPHDSRSVILNDLEATIRRVIGAGNGGGSNNDDMVERSPRASPVMRPNARTPAASYPERPNVANLPVQYRATGVRASGIASPAASPRYGVSTSAPPPHPAAPPSATTAGRAASSPKPRRNVDIFSGVASASPAAAPADSMPPPRAGMMGIPSGKKLNRHGLAPAAPKAPVAAAAAAAAHQPTRAPAVTATPSVPAPLLPARRRRIDESLVTESSGNILNSSDERPASDEDEEDRGDRTPDAAEEDDEGENEDDDEDADGDVNMSLKATKSRTETTKKRRASKKQRVASPSPPPAASAAVPTASPSRSAVATNAQRPPAGSPTTGKPGDFASTLVQKRAMLTQLLKGDQKCVTGLLKALPHFRSADGSDASGMGLAAINQIIDELQRDPSLPANLISGTIKFEDYMRTRPSASRK
jgi:hypothetical protein